MLPWDHEAVAELQFAVNLRAASSQRTSGSWCAEPTSSVTTSLLPRPPRWSAAGITWRHRGRNVEFPTVTSRWETPRTSRATGATAAAAGHWF